MNNLEKKAKNNEYSWYNYSASSLDADTVTWFLDSDCQYHFSVYMVSNDVLDFIYNTHRHLIIITQWNHNMLNLIQLHYRFTVTLFPTKELLYIILLGSLMRPVRPLCRPGEHQRVIYNGHKRVHALKFQCVALPNGLIGNLFGPVGKFCRECLYKERVGDFNFTIYDFNKKYWKSVRGKEWEAYVTNLYKKHF